MPINSSKFPPWLYSSNRLRRAEFGETYKTWLCSIRARISLIWCLPHLCLRCGFPLTRWPSLSVLEGLSPSLLGVCTMDAFCTLGFACIMISQLWLCPLWKNTLSWRCSFTFSPFHIIFLCYLSLSSNSFLPRQKKRRKRWEEISIDFSSFAWSNTSHQFEFHGEIE